MFASAITASSALSTTHELSTLRRCDIGESFGSHSLTTVIEALSTTVIGKDPREIELIGEKRTSR
ncbi:MAG: hypothetical protein ACR2FX_01080 [Chthoniobacterales bacterium]